MINHEIIKTEYTDASSLMHNRITLNQLEDYVKRGKDCCVVNPCGSGKTSVMADFLKNHADKSAVILTKQANAKAYYEGKDPCFLNTTIKTYSMMLSDYRNDRMDEYNTDFLIVDEAHYIGANKWSEAFTYIRDSFDPLVIGFTATPQRFENQGTEDTIVTEYFDGNSAGNFTARQLQQQGVFKEPEYILSLYNLESEIEDRLEKLEDAGLSDQKISDYKQKFYDIYTDWKRTSCPEVVLSKSLPRYMYKKSSNRILVYMSSVEEIGKKKDEVNALIQKIFPKKKIASYRYTYKDSERNLESFLEEDGAYIKILYSVDKIMETIHIDDLNIVIMMRPSVSNRIITQQFGRINSIGNDKKPLVIDMVGNLNNINSVSFLYAGTGEAKEKHGTGSLDFNISYAMKYARLFSAIDSVFSKTVYYTYDGITETLHNLCEIYRKDFHEVRDLVKNQKMDIEDAFKITRTSRKTTVTSDLFNGTCTYPEFTLTDWQKEIAENNITVIERFIKRKDIKDEDIVQDLYMEYLYSISRIGTKKDINGQITHYLLTRIKTQYLKLLRMKVAREQLYEYDRIDDMDLYTTSDLSDIAFSNIIGKKIPKLIHTLSEREQVVLNYRFGYTDGEVLTLEETAKLLNVTRERIRQIEAKALRKLRHLRRQVICVDFRDSEVDLEALNNTSHCYIERC